MPPEPANKRAFAFIDGQNLFYAAKHAFGYTFPNYDASALAVAVCQESGWTLSRVYFYTGIPSVQDDPFWNHFWTAKLAVMGTRGVVTFARHLKYRNQTVTLPDRTTTTVLVGQEKGVDVRLALDIVRLGREGAYDVAVVFSQDQDLSEVADEVRAISLAQQRWIKTVSAFPVSPAYANTRGVNRTDWVRFDRALYDRCIDRIDYRAGFKS
jgi:uncharacterized LabA/DUF88 family protein